MKYKIMKTLIITCLGLVLVSPNENKVNSNTNATIESDVVQSINNNENKLVPTSTIEEDIAVETKLEESKNKTQIKETPKKDSSEKKEIVEHKQESNKKIQETKGNKTNIGTYKLTAYCPCSKCCGKWAGGKTASGTVPTQGRTVACNTLAAGTKININGHDYIVEDTGNMKGNVIDIFFDSHKEALKFGVKYAEVFVYNN